MNYRHYSQLFVQALKNPYQIRPFIRRNVKKYYSKYKYRNYRQERGIPRQKQRIHKLVREDEFVLVILDSSRFDYFESEYEQYFSGELDMVWSAGNRTPRWTPNTWDGEYNLDYLSTISYPVSKLAYEDKKHKFDPNSTFKNAIHISNDSKLLSSTSAETVTDVALQYFSSRDKIRGVVHYCQPHRPYLGDTMLLPWRIDADEFVVKADEIGIQYELSKAELTAQGVLFGEDLLELGISDTEFEELNPERYEVRDRIKDNQLTNPQLQTAYRDNLQYVLKEVERLISYLDCPVVVSADHGEHLGEHTDELVRYNHPNQTHPILREVPWLVVDAESKGYKSLSNIQEDEELLGRYTDAATEREIREQLEALGYR